MNRAPSNTEKQRARVLERLRAHGTTHAGEWKDGGRAVDGGDEIVRLAARIGELQERQYGGHRIVDGGRTPARFQIYRLVDVKHLPTATSLPHKPWHSIVRCINCHTVWPPLYDGECCGEDRFLISFTIRPPAATTSEAIAA